MKTCAPGVTGVQAELIVHTSRATEFVDLTDRVALMVATRGLRIGLVNIQTRHTTTAVVVNEHEPLLLADFELALERIAPVGGGYAHDDPAIRQVNLAPGERSNGHAHCRALMMPSSAVLNVCDGRLQLGQWQRLFLVELDGPRTRHVSVVLIGVFDDEPGKTRQAP
jgi:secondary thiamine-phosphate synthase enzyme